MVRTAIYCLIGVLGLWRAVAAQDASPAQFVGTWVGTQTWAIENPPPNAITPQPIELTIELVDGKLVGTMAPFFGGADGAKFVDAQIAGDALKAAAVMGRLTGWKTNVKINFDFKVTDKNQLVGTADVLMGQIKWTTFKYDLNRKRSRY